MKTKMRTKLVAAILSVSMLFGTTSVNAATIAEKNTGIELEIYAEGAYSNWDGVSNVSQFVNEKGQFCFAYDNGKNVIVVKTKNGKVQKNTIKLKKKHDLFGGVTCDSKGNYYLVTGETNETEDTSKNTIFISKYDKNGKHVKTVGDNGSASLGWWYDSSFYTKIPFDGGNCDIAINGNTLTVNYARQMYSGHQSNSVFTINTQTMEKLSVGNVYNSHSFAQRAIPYKDGFVLASEGDCYPRAFTINYVAKDGSFNYEGDSFHFWVKKGALDEWNMWLVNDNFARMGGVAAVNDTTVCLVGQSVKALDKKAEKQSEQVFIQIFDPTKDLGSASAYVTSGKRSGLSGGNGDEEVTDYGVKWLTNTDKSVISNTQVVSDGNGTIVVLFEQYASKTWEYEGVYYIILDEKGNVVSKKQKYSAAAQLNPYVMPVYTKGSVYWIGNKSGDSSNKMYVYSLKVN